MYLYLFRIKLLFFNQDMLRLLLYVLSLYLYMLWMTITCYTLRQP